GEYKEIKSNTLAFAINKAALTVTAKPASIIYGQSPANEGVTYEGFVQGDNEAVLSGNVEYSYNYNRLDDVGSYEISLEESTLESNNYEISYEKGALIVEPKQVELEWHNVDNRIEKDKKSVSATVNGIEDGDNVTAKVSGGKAQKPGSYVATAELTGGKAGNYRLADNAVNYKLKTRKMAGVLLATVAMKGKSTAVLTWTPVEDAEYYEVYMSLCNYKKTVGKWKKVKTVKAGKKLIWKKSGLKHGRNYKFKVIAIKGKQTLKSPTLHSIVGNVHGKRTNAGSIKALNKTINLKVGGTAKAKAKLKGVKKNHGILAKWHIEKIRYISDNTSVATVTDKGVIKGRNKGTCKVYLIAPNGLYSTIKVRVK
ncbi:MAG: MBG domain-containing protein, partial [Bacillota bacterium]|nr:MBG domain-containing protein [Bacillota bacterium]